MLNPLVDVVRLSRRSRDDEWEEIASFPARVADGSLWVDVDLSFKPGDIVTDLSSRGYEVVGTAPVADRPVRRVYIRRLRVEEVGHA